MAGRGRGHGLRGRAFDRWHELRSGRKPWRQPDQPRAHEPAERAGLLSRARTDARRGPLRSEVERSTDGTNYAVVASLGGNQTSLALTNQPNGQVSYRVRALTPGRIGSYATPSSNASTILVDLRGKVDITGQVEKAISNVSFTGGVFKLDLNFKNISASNYVPLVEANVVGISSTSGTVSVKNADNGADGKSAATAALYRYSNLLGADQVFTTGETTGNRSLEFNDPSAEMFN